MVLLIHLSICVACMVFIATFDVSFCTKVGLFSLKIENRENGFIYLQHYVSVLFNPLSNDVGVAKYFLTAPI